MTVAEVFRSVTDGIWGDLPNGVPREDKRPMTSVIRRNLQREHVKQMSGLVLGQKSSGGFYANVIFAGGGSSVPPDAAAWLACTCARSASAFRRP